MAIAMDALLCGLAALMSLYLRTGDVRWFGEPLLILSACSLSFWFPIAWTRKTYLSLLRFAGGRTMIGLGVTVAIFTIPMVVLFMFVTVPGVPRTMALLQPIVFLTLLSISRLAIRFVIVDLLGKRSVASRTRRRVCIYGAGRAGQQLASALRHEPQMQLVAFLDDDERLHNQILDGVSILAKGDRGADLTALAIDEVLLAIPSASRARRREIIEYLSSRSVAVRSLPSVGHIIEGQVTVSDLREIQVEELLGRDPIPPNEVLLGKNITGKVVAVTGAGGSIGGELCRQIVDCRPSKIILIEQSEYGLYAIERELVKRVQRLNSHTQIASELCDVASKKSIARVMDRHRPYTVFHAAAYKHVPLVEENPIEGLRNNIFGTLYTCQAAETAGVAQFILISTDKAVRPTNVMGVSKRICELILQARAADGSATTFSMVRFGNVLGSSGSVVPLFKDQIRSGGPITVTDFRVTRYFMTIPEAAQLVIQAGAMAKGGEVFVLEMGEPIKIADLAITMIHLYGMTEITEDNPVGDIQIVEVGLRPGEKLYEELLIGENPQPTKHERIIKAHEAFLPWDTLERHLAELEVIVAEGHADSALIKMSCLVPDYLPRRQCEVSVVEGG